mgnify:CR=1 FL=1
MLKYRGGKSREIPQFEKYIPESFSTYIEPFFGGGAVFFHLEPERAIINDVNDRLISFYQCVRNQYAAMRAELDQIQEIYERNQTTKSERLKHQKNGYLMPTRNCIIVFVICTMGKSLQSIWMGFCISSLIKQPTQA